MPTKAELRKQMLQLRKGLDPAQVKAASEAICQQFFDQFDLSSISRLHVFLSIRELNELDTWPIIRRLWQEHPDIRLAVPVTPPGADNLQHRELTPRTNLIRSKWGIEEPDQTSPQVPEQEVDLVLVPLLAVDRRGHRVGYGKGYYDRFLGACRPEALKIGLSLFEPLEQIEDTGPWDMPLDYCISPSQIYKF